MYHEPHKKLMERVEKIRDLKEQIKKEGRPPTDAEVKQIAKYNESMQVKVNNIMREVLE